MRLSVAGIIFAFIACKQTIVSNVPAAEIKWPLYNLVLEIGMLMTFTVKSFNRNHVNIPFAFRDKLIVNLPNTQQKQILIFVSVVPRGIYNPLGVN